MKKIILVVILLAAIAAAYFFFFRSGVPGMGTLVPFEDQSMGIRMEYPKSIFSVATGTAFLPPDFGISYSGPVFTHAAPLQHCGLSGLPSDCTPTTKDITIGFFSIPKQFSDVQSALQNAFPGLIQPTSLGGRSGVMFESGAEGEGVFYYFLPRDASDTLVVARSFINEEMELIYKNAAGFIPYADQEKTFDEVAGTLTFLAR